MSNPSDASAVAIRPTEDLELDPSALPTNGRLVESVCNICGARAFPARTICIGCMSDDLSSAPLPDTGVLYSFTTVHVSSARPTPYALGYVDLPDGVRILAPLQGAADVLTIAAPVELQVADDHWYFTPTKGA